MSWETMLILAALTYGSRAAALAFLPPMPPAVAAVLARMPSPLFAGLAASALLTPEGGLAGIPVLAATIGALVAAPLRSLPVCLVVGLTAYLFASLIA